jgi:hypothetical protein
VTPEQLVEIEAIKRLKYKYLRCVDQKEWAELEECFVPDATTSYGGGTYSQTGRDAIMAFLRKSMGDETFLSSHRVHHPEIELTSPTTATGVWALEDVVIDQKHGLTIQGAAFYRDEYVKVNGRWLIRHTGYKRSFEEIFPRQAVSGLRLTASWWGTGGKTQLGG